jgi:hypothetical protein
VYACGCIRVAAAREIRRFRGLLFHAYAWLRVGAAPAENRVRFLTCEMAALSMQERSYIRVEPGISTLLFVWFLCFLKNSYCKSSIWQKELMCRRPPFYDLKNSS